MKRHQLILFKKNTFEMKLEKMYRHYIEIFKIVGNNN